MTLTKSRRVRTPANHNKRSGRHHQRNEHYIKPYWPYLPIFAILLLGVVFNSWLGHVHHDVLGYATNISPQVLLAETNGERISGKEPALQLNAQLSAAAQAKANDMAKRGYWSHVTPDGKQPWNFIDTAGYEYAAAGENLAYGFSTSDQVITAWMHSPTHRANVLNANYQDVGFATANVSNYQGAGPATIVVAMYGEPASAAVAGAPVKASHANVLGSEEQVSRLQLINTTSWLPLFIAALAGGTLALFFARHAFAWHKVLVKGERFFVAHPFFDVFLVSAAVFAFLLSHIAGTIL